MVISYCTFSSGPTFENFVTRFTAISVPRQKQTLQVCVAVCCSELQCVAVCCIVLQCVAVCCSVLQCVAVRCSVLQCVAVCSSVLQCVAMCCSILQCVAVCCSLLQCVAVCCNVCAVCCSVLQCAKTQARATAVCVIVLQCVAVTHCNTHLQQAHMMYRLYRMGWLRSVGSIKLYVSFAEYWLLNRALLQKRPVVLSILLIEATKFRKTQ